MAMEIRKAQRGNSKPLIGLHSQSGAGKTYSALLLARGFVGATGTICMIETEAGRGEAYADPEEYPEIGGYDVVSLTGDFSSVRYGEAIETVEGGAYGALIIDSASHEWENVGGVLDWAAKNAETKRGVLVWQQPKIAHKKHFVLKFTNTPIPLVILCMRSRYPMIDTGRTGNDKWIKSATLDPIQSDDILFEMFVHGWVGLGDHAFHCDRCTARGLETLFAETKPISLETGQQLRAWCETTGRAVDAAKGAKEGGQAPEEEAAVGLSQEDTAALIARAESIAATGTENLKAFWTELGKIERLALKPDWDRIKRGAAPADGGAVI